MQRTFSSKNPRTFPSHLQRAQTTKRSLRDVRKNSSFNESEHTYATGAFEIHVFAPLRTKPPSTSSATVSIPAGSEPWFGSVNPLEHR